MSDEEKILLAVHVRTIELAAMEPPPAWRTWDYFPYLEACRHGPHYAFGEWFGSQPNYIRQRYLRTIYALAERGLIEITKSNGGKLAHLRLTAAGLELATKLQEQP